MNNNKSSLLGGIRIAPLSGGFMLMGLLAFFSAVLFIRTISLDWAFIIGFIGVIMFLASMISMTKAPVLEELLIDEHISDRKARIRVMSKKQYEEYVKAKKKKSKLKKKSVKKATKKKSTKKKSTKKKATKKKSTKKKSTKKKSTKRVAKKK